LERISNLAKVHSSFIEKNVLNILISYMEHQKLIKHLPKIYRVKQDLQNGIYNFPELVFMTNCFMAVSSGYHHLLEQISDYDWVETKAIMRGVERLSFIPNDTNFFEILISRTIFNISINGRPDYIDYTNKIVWEFKFVNAIIRDHMLQIILYAWIMKLDLNEWKLYIFNIKTGEIRSINKIENIDQIVIDIIMVKSAINVVISDKDFITRSKLAHINPIVERIKESKARGKIACFSNS
jgi:hypothetical protein